MAHKLVHSVCLDVQILFTKVNFMSSGSYVVAHFSNSEWLLPAIETLGGCTDVLRWDAVDGNAHVIIKLKPTPSPTLPNTILNIKGIDRLTHLSILAEHENERRINSLLCHSYVFVESEAGKSDLVEKALRQMDSAIYCSTLASGSEFVVLVEGKDFETVEEIINGKIRMLDGVLRLKKNRVIELREM